MWLLAQRLLLIHLAGQSAPGLSCRVYRVIIPVPSDTSVFSSLPSPSTCTGGCDVFSHQKYDLP